MALINKLNNIGDAIRAKTGKEDKLTLEQMVTEIAAIETGGSEPAVVEALVVTENGTYTPGEGVDGFNPVTVEVPTSGGDLPEEAVVITGDCQYRFANNGWNWFIDTFGNQITTQNITNFSYMFYYATVLKEIPFELNADSSASSHDSDSIFFNCYKLITVPKINNLKPSNLSSFFSGCKMLREVPFDLCDNWNWTYIDGLTVSYGGSRIHTFYNCYSLRSFPMEFLAHGNPVGSYNFSIYSSAFDYCYALDEIVNLPIPYTATWTSNGFGSAFEKCYRLKNMTFALQEDGTPYIMNWKSQTIDLSKNVGYSVGTADILKYNSGITADKQIKDADTYAALKDDVDWFTTDIAYSRYNHDSAVATINSLPDTSAYLATQTSGTNTIKFKGKAGSKTDGGAINTLTEEEIAVATAKGWTVTLV